MTLLEALAAKPAPSALLAVAGDGRFEPSFAAAVKRRAERLGLARRVEWLGALYDSALAERLAASQVLVVPSMYEGFGIAYLEGMAFGLPAIGGSDGGASEVIRDGENGFLVRPGDVAALADRLRLLADDRMRLESLSITALQTFRIHPTWSQTGETIRRFLYEQTISPGAAAHLTLKEETA
jgi:glycosyltransferase involved in cell wall biosynthesis